MFAHTQKMVNEGEPGTAVAARWLRKRKSRGTKETTNKRCSSSAPGVFSLTLRDSSEVTASWPKTPGAKEHPEKTIELEVDSARGQ